MILLMISYYFRVAFFKMFINLLQFMVATTTVIITTKLLEINLKIYQLHYCDPLKYLPALSFQNICSV